MFVICVNHSSSCRAANAGVFILNDLLPLNRLPLNKAHAIILSSCLTVSIEGIGGKVFGGGSPQLYYHDCSGRIICMASKNCTTLDLLLRPSALE